MFVEFESEANKRIVSVFSGAQDPTDYPFQGVVSWDDDRFQDYYERQSDYGKESLLILKVDE